MCDQITPMVSGTWMDGAHPERVKRRLIGSLPAERLPWFLKSGAQIAIAYLPSVVQVHRHEIARTAAWRSAVAGARFIERPTLSGLTANEFRQRIRSARPSADQAVIKDIDSLILRATSRMEMETGGCCFPDDRLYDSEATVWVRLPDNSFTIGLTPLHGFIVGKVNSVLPKPAASNLAEGRGIAFIETMTYSGNGRTPLSGVVEDVNGKVIANPLLINTDPYGKGWIAKLRPLNLETERTFLSTQDDAKKAAEKVIQERGLRFFSTYPAHRVSGIGGECPETLKALGDILEATSPEDAALLVTDNPHAEQDVPRWVSIRGYHILESRFEEPLKYYVIGKSGGDGPGQALRSAGTDGLFSRM